MTRPLRYDDNFTNIINEKLHERFLNLFTIKVQSTAFFQKLNLQKSLMIVSFVDFFVGLFVLLIFFKTIQHKAENLLFFFENFLLMSGICFGLLGLDTAINLKKMNSKVYKNWKIFTTFSILALEIVNNFEMLCFYLESCDKFFNIIILLIVFVVNVYFIKICWSFFIRLDRGHELLIIHGKYLEKMMEDESYKIKDVKKFVPPELSYSPVKKFTSDNLSSPGAGLEMTDTKEEILLFKTPQ